MEKRNGKVIINRAGGTASSSAKTYKISLPTSWVNELGINDDDRNVVLSFDGEKIIISKKQGVDEFINSRQSNNLVYLNYYNGDRLCTKIVADYTALEIALENYSFNPIELAFGVNQTPTWDDYEAFLEERCVPRERDGLREMLEALGLYEYNPLEIVKKTQGKMAEDNQWLETEVL